MFNWQVVLKSTKLKSIVSFVLLILLFIFQSDLKFYYGKYTEIINAIVVFLFFIYGAVSPGISIFERYFDLKYVKKRELSKFEKKFMVC